MNKSTSNTTSESSPASTIYPSASVGHMEDMMDIKLIQLEAMLTVACGDSGKAFREDSTEDTQDAYMWTCRTLTSECLALLQQVFEKRCSAMATADNSTGVPTKTAALEKILAMSQSLEVLNSLVGLIQGEVEKHNNSDFDDIGALAISARREAFNLGKLIANAEACFENELECAA